MSKRRKTNGNRNFDSIMEVKQTVFPKQTVVIGNHRPTNRDRTNAKATLVMQPINPADQADITLQQAMESYAASGETKQFLHQLQPESAKVSVWPESDDASAAFLNPEQTPAGPEDAISADDLQPEHTNAEIDSAEEQLALPRAEEAFAEESLLSEQMLFSLLHLQQENRILLQSKQNGIEQKYHRWLQEEARLKLLHREYELLMEEAEPEVYSKAVRAGVSISRALQQMRSARQKMETQFPWLKRKNQTEESEKNVNPAAVAAEPACSVNQEAAAKPEPFQAEKDDFLRSDLPPMPMDSRLTLRGGSDGGQPGDKTPGRPMINNVPLLMVDDSEYTDWHNYLYHPANTPASTGGRSHVIFKAVAGGNDNDAACYMLEMVRYGKRILIDAGIRLSGRIERLPNVQTIPKPDLIIITHAHYSQCGALPYLVKRWPDLPVWCSKDSEPMIGAMLDTLLRPAEDQDDYFIEAPVYEAAEIKAVQLTVKEIGVKYYPFHDDLSITLYAAGHLPGAVSIAVQGQDDSVFITADFTKHKEKTALAAVWPTENFDIMILNITNGQFPHFERQAMEQVMISKVNEILSNGGCALFPCAELGRAENFAFLFRQAMTEGKLKKVPLYADGRCNQFFKLMEEHMQTDATTKPQTGFLYADSFRWSVTPIDETNRQNVANQPCILFVNPGMLTEKAPGFTYLCKMMKDDVSAVFLPTVSESLVALAPLLEKLSKKQPGKKSEILYYHWPSHPAQDELLDAIEYLRPQVVLLVHGNAEAHRAMRTAIPSSVMRRSVTTGETIRVRPQEE
ncbi:MAG: MBL fold metallo-hydrolase [Negativicutes bacterium]|nr:MBL fold metallo-hydrolase [Negativicutes bacterium]